MLNSTNDHTSYTQSLQLGCYIASVVFLFKKTYSGIRSMICINVANSPLKNSPSCEGCQLKL